MPTAPRNPSVYSIKSDSLSVKWEDPDELRGVLDHYTVYWSPTEGSTGSMKVVENNATISGLKACQKYKVTVTATTGGGEGEPSEECEETTDIEGRYSYFIHCGVVNSMIWITPAMTLLYFSQFCLQFEISLELQNLLP